MWYGVVFSFNTPNGRSSSAMFSLCRFHGIWRRFFHSLSFYKTLRLLSSYFIQWRVFRSSHPNFWGKPQTFVLTSSFESDLSRPIFTKKFLLEYWVLTQHCLFNSTNCLDNKLLVFFVASDSNISSF